MNACGREWVREADILDKWMHGQYRSTGYLLDVCFRACCMHLAVKFICFET